MNFDLEGANSANQPLIGSAPKNEAFITLGPNDVRFKNFNDEEEATKMLRITCLHFSWFKSYVVVPILALCTALFFLLFLYWFPKLRKAFFYSECNFRHATHLFIVGTRK
jgi:P5-type ATPase cation transporter